MGKDAHDAHAAGACCHACERWASAPAEPPAVVLPELADVVPGAVELVITERGVPMGTFVIEGPRIRVGRGSQCELSIPDGSLSRVQAYFEIRNGTLFVSDSGSGCGTYIDGRRLIEPTRLHDGTVVSFANHDLRVTRRPD